MSKRVQHRYSQLPIVITDRIENTIATSLTKLMSRALMTFLFIVKRM